MDRNNNETAEITFEIGQARKSLWIETIRHEFAKIIDEVRLVRACGSKQVNRIDAIELIGGQARKSLWIET